MDIHIPVFGINVVYWMGSDKIIYIYPRKNSIDEQSLININNSNKASYSSLDIVRYFNELLPFFCMLCNPVILIILITHDDSTLVAFCSIKKY